MPIIEFEGPDGERVEQFHHTRIDYVQIDGKPFKRVEVPSRIQLGGTASAGDAPEEQVRRGCYAMECAGKWQSKFTKGQIKRVWGL